LNLRQNYRMRKFLLLIFLCLNQLCFGPALAEGEDFEINHADNLEILPDRIVLSGGVSVSSGGDQKFTLTTGKLVSLKNAAGEFGDIETFGQSKIVSDRFSLSTEKLFFRKDLKTKKFNLLDANGKVVISSNDGAQKINAPKVKIDLDKRILYAREGVRSEQLIEQDGKKQKVTITSQEQDIDLQENQEPSNGSKQNKPIVSKKAKGKLVVKEDPSLSLKKQLTARQNVVTTLEEATINSQVAELYTKNGKGEKAIFTGDAKLNTKDKTSATGEIINYFLNDKLLLIESRSKPGTAHLIREDGTEITGNVIRYNSVNKSLTVESGPQDAQLVRGDGTKISGKNIKYNTENKELSVDAEENIGQALLKVPFKEKDGSTSYITIKADSIINEELKPGESLLTARQKSETGLVELDYGTRKGWARQLYISQNTNIPDKKADKLVLIDHAKMVDSEKSQVLEGPVIQIGLGEKTLYSGFTGRAKGSIPLIKQEDDKKPKGKNTAESNSKTAKKNTTQKPVSLF
jgi:hypothetical protein